MKGFFLSLFSFFFFQSNAQPIGSWKLHFSFSNNYGMEDAGDKVYAASAQSFFAYNKADGTIDFFDKANVLSDVGVKQIDYNKTSNTLAITYNNSNIDLLVNGTDVYNIPDVKNKVIAGTKAINNICNSGARIYLATDIGIVVLNQQKKEIAETYVIGANGSNVKINDVATGNNRIFAATTQGIKSASLSNPNLLNFNNWKAYTTADGLPTGNPIAVEFANSTFYTLLNDTLYEFNGTVWSKKFYESGWKSLRLDSHDDELILLQSKLDNSQGRVVKITSTTTDVLQNSGNVPVNYFKDNDGTVWYSDAWYGIYKNGERIIPDGPNSQNAYSISIKNDVVWVSGGGTDLSWGPTYNYSGLYVYQNDKWTSFNQYTTPALNDFPDIVAVLGTDDGKKAWLGSNFSGLAEVDLGAGTIKQYDQYNSPLTFALGDPPRTKATAIALDKQNNLWMQNAYAANPLTVRKADGTWVKFPGYMYNVLGKKMIITSNGYKWMSLRPGVISVFYEGKSIDDFSDDVYRVVATGKGSGGLNNGGVNAMVEDKDGAVWVGTDEGIEIFFCARSILSQNGCDAQRIIVERDGFNGFLFATEVVRALAVDAANRKWVGTNSGVWLISADGKTEILKFNSENSPLPSNFITDIAVNDKTGEVFFATEKGLASYKGDAIAGGEKCGSALVYPNPVEASYSGPIAVKNLVDEAYVKITDATGALVHQGKANGGQMIWDGNTYSGRRVATGVYTVFSANELGKERCVAKIAIVN